VPYSLECLVVRSSPEFTSCILDGLRAFWSEFPSASEMSHRTIVLILFAAGPSKTPWSAP